MTENIDMSSAVQTAFEAITRDLYPEMDLPDLLLEEVLLRRGVWEVTIGFTSPYSPQTTGSLGGVFPQSKTRVYKRVLIDGKTGEVRGMLDGRIDED